MDQTNPSRRKGLLTWTFVRALVRIYIACVEAYLCVGAKVPEWLVNMLPAAERITSGILWAMLVAPDVLANIRLGNQPMPKTPRVYETLIISEAELRRRIANIKAILKDPRDETARLKAIADARGIKIIKLSGLRPLDFLITPHTDDLRHACASGKITPRARPPPIPRSTAKIHSAGEAPASAALRAGTNQKANFRAHLASSVCADL